MRLIAIPLARARPGLPPVSTFLAQKAPVAPSFVASRPAPVKAGSEAKAAGASGTSPSQKSSDTTIAGAPGPAAPPPAEGAGDGADKGKLPLMSRIMNKAADFWVGLGREDQKSTFDWKRRTYVLGESLMDRIEYEEWALKGVDPALGPSLTDPAPGQRRESEGQGKEETPAKDADAALPTQKPFDVSLLYPPSLMKPKAIITALTKMTASRGPHHRQRLIYCMVGIPLTAPFALIPVIPNLPFFYLAWRAFSHWRALQSSRYLAELLSQGRIVPAASSELDKILASPVPITSKPASASTSESDATNVASADGSEGETKDAEGKAGSAAPSAEVEERMILKEHHIKLLTEEFKMDRQLPIDLHRARLQTIKAIQEGQLDKLEAAAKLGEEDAGPTAADPSQPQKQ